MNRLNVLVSLLLAAAVLAAPAQSAPQGGSFTANLSGGEEVPSVATQASGQAVFELNEDGTMLKYKLTVANIENVTQAHIHLGAAGTNGPIVAWLYPSAPPPVLKPGITTGVLAEGTITAENLVGPLAGKPLSALVDAMKAGDTYANVHTAQHPDGEIRGQIREAARVPGATAVGTPSRQVSVPEFPSGILLPVAGVLAMALLLYRRRES